MANRNCPACHSRQTKRLSVVYEQGLSVINTSSNTGGVGLGFGGLGVGIARSRTRGVSQTALSQKAAPPAKMGCAKPLVTIFVVYAFLNIFDSQGANVANALAAGWLCCSVAAITIVSNYNSKTWPPLKAAWDRTYLCTRCGHMFTVNEDPAHARYQARLDARDLSPLPSAPTVYLDTETTGLYPSDGAEIIEVAICDDDGNALVNSFVKPTQRTEWPDAQAINGISPAMVADAPLLADLLPAIRAAVAGKRVVIYNAGFDVKFFPADLFDGCDIKCCMLRYAEHAGDWNDSRRDWRWHKLTSAAYDVGHAWTGDAHRALGDTLATRSVWRWMQEQTR